MQKLQEPNNGIDNESQQSTDDLSKEQIETKEEVDFSQIVPVDDTPKQDSESPDEQDSKALDETVTTESDKTKKRFNLKTIVVIAVALVILIAGIGIGVSLSQCSNDANDQHEDSEPVEPAPILDKTVSSGDLAFKISSNWRQEPGEDNFTYYYPDSNNEIMIMSSFEKLERSTTTETDFDYHFASFLDGTEGTVLNSNKSEHSSLDKYPAYDAVIIRDFYGTSYSLHITALYRSDASQITYITFGVPEAESARWQNVISAVMSTIVPTEAYISDEKTRDETAKAEAEEAAVAEVISKIDAIGEVTLNSESAISSAEKAYGLLLPGSQLLVSNYDVLVSARSSYDELKATQEAAEQAERDRIANETTSQKNAVKMAKNYLQTMPFSKQGLIGQLEYEGFSNDDASYGAEYCEADWMLQAEKMAENYLDLMSFSRQGLIEQLQYEGFTYEEAVHGVDSTGL